MRKLKFELIAPSNWEIVHCRWCLQWCIRTTLPLHRWTLHTLQQEAALLLRHLQQEVDTVLPSHYCRSCCRITILHWREGRRWRRRLRRRQMRSRWEEVFILLLFNIYFLKKYCAWTRVSLRCMLVWFFWCSCCHETSLGRATPSNNNNILWFVSANESQTIVEQAHEAYKRGPRREEMKKESCTILSPLPQWSRPFCWCCFLFLVPSRSLIKERYQVEWRSIRCILQVEAGAENCSSKVGKVLDSPWFNLHQKNHTNVHLK